VYAIIEDSGCQIKVKPGDVLDLDPREDAGKSLTFDRILAVGSDKGAATLGTPYVAGATVTAEVVDEILGEKIVIMKYRRRKGYRRHTGHRQPYLRVRIKDINS
jgi:large subunit ribosomal protein L21